MPPWHFSSRAHPKRHHKVTVGCWEAVWTGSSSTIGGLAVSVAKMPALRRTLLPERNADPDVPVGEGEDGQEGPFPDLRQSPATGIEGRMKGRAFAGAG